MKGVSAIICCYNSEKLIDRCLKHLFNQQFNAPIPWEIIVVNNNSSDSTVPLAYEAEKKYNGRKVKFLVVDEVKSGLIYARKKGRDVASFDYLVYSDDDNFFNDNYIETAYKIMESGEEIGIVGGLGIAEFENPDINPPWFDVHQLSYAVGPQANNNLTGNETGFVYGAGIIIRKSVWLMLENHGFENLLCGRKREKLSSGEDTELCYAFRLAGYKIYYEPSLVFKHLIANGRTKIEYLEDLYFGFGKSNLVIGIYDHYLHSDINPKSVSRFPLWINRLFYLKKLLTQYKKDKKNIVPFSKEWSKRIEIKGQIKAVWELRSGYDKFFDKVLALKKSIRNY